MTWRLRPRCVAVTKVVTVLTFPVVFCMLGGSPLSASHVRLLFHRMGLTAGLAKRVHPHGLRHTHAAQLREQGIDIGIISKQLGHCSIATTAQYLDHIAPYAVIDAIRGRDWHTACWPGDLAILADWA